MTKATTKRKYQIKIKYTQNVWPSQITNILPSNNDVDLDPKRDG